ncbi:MAG: hypothetical protein Q9216_007247 [Gyalolechia sp. 2 TL-2023]
MSAAPEPGRWHVHTNKENTVYGGAEARWACQMAFYLPAVEGAAPKPVSAGLGAPQGNQCMHILGAIAEEAKSESVMLRTEWKEATVNLVRPPSGVEGMWALGLGEGYDGSERSDGQAVNAGYPSYTWKFRYEEGYPKTVGGSSCPDPVDPQCV